MKEKNHLLTDLATSCNRFPIIYFLRDCDRLCATMDFLYFSNIENKFFFVPCMFLCVVRNFHFSRLYSRLFIQQEQIQSGIYRKKVSRALNCNLL